MRIRSGRAGGNFLIWFEDSGEGVEEGMEELICEPGFRSPTAVERYKGGQGLGLAVVRAIVGAHGGTIKLTRRAQPTIVTIALPYSLAVEAREKHSIV